MNSLLENAVQNLGQNAVQNLGQNAVQNLGQNAVQNLGQQNNLSPTAAPTQTSQSTSQEDLPLPAVQTAALPSPAALKNGIVQLMTELNRDTEFKKMIAEKSLDYAYSAIDEKAGKVGQTIADLKQLQTNFEKTPSTDLETLKSAVAKYNQDFNNILAGQTAMTGGRKPFTRRRSSSRAFRKTRGRRRSSQ